MFPARDGVVRIATGRQTASLSNLHFYLVLPCMHACLHACMCRAGAHMMIAIAAPVAFT